MKMKTKSRLLRGAFAAGALTMLVALSPPAAAVDCGQLPNPVYVAGSTAAKPIVAEVGKIMVSQNLPATVVYSGRGSCTGVDAVLNGTPLRGTGTTAFSYWDLTGAESKCDVALDGPGVVADVGISDVFVNTCFALPGGMPANVGDFLGPVQVMTFVVPKNSPERAISAEAAYYVFGFGANSGVAPWTDEPWIFRRDDQSGTQRLIATAIGVHPARWKGTATTSTSDMLTKVTVAGAGAQTIGILSAEVAQENRGVLNILAYQHSGQTCGYYPDRDATSNEKINVRDGHYAIWGPLHLLTRLSSNGYPVKISASDVIGYVSGSKVAPAGLDPIALEAQLHMVPRCAMRVTRVQEMGPLSSFAPSGSCGCYFEKVANGTTSCMACTASTGCPPSAPVCSYGYCETQ